MVSVEQPAFLAEGPASGRQALSLPPAREFVLSAGFGGAAALLAALLIVLIVAFAVWRASKRHRTELAQQQRQHAQVRADAQHAAAVLRCEQRFKWVVETAGIEPATSEGATLGLGPELALEILQGLHRDAKELGDDTLVRAITVYFNQLSLVLAQQGSLLSRFDGGANADYNGEYPGSATAQAGHADATNSPTIQAGGVAADSMPDVGAADPGPESPETKLSTHGARSVNVSRRRRRQ